MFIEEKLHYYFYVLIDPRDNLIKYVGRTVNLKNRLRSHFYEAKNKNRNKREKWINLLLKIDKEPIMQVIYQKNYIK